MKKIALLMLLIALAASCGDGGNHRKGREGIENRTVAENARGQGSGDRTGKEDKSAPVTGSGTESGSETGREPHPGDNRELAHGAVLIATDIVTEVIVRPDPEGDPWETEKVAGYDGEALVDGIFNRIYDGSLTVFDYHSGEPLKPGEVKMIEEEFSNDRTKIGKLSFTEDWYWYPEENRLDKRAKSVTFGYELYNNTGKVYAYRAAFRADLN